MEALGASGDRAAVRAALRTSLVALDGAFEADELAFLAATSKVELPVRDRLAWSLHRTLGNRFVVAREWRRSDLAVLTLPDAPDDGEDTIGGTDVVALVEAKALYAFDVLSNTNRQRYLERLSADADKMGAWTPSDRYLLSLIVDVRGDIDPAHADRVVKYATGITRAVASHGEKVRAVALEQWLEELSAFGCETDVAQLDAGWVWDLEVSVDACLTGPLVVPGA